MGGWRAKPVSPGLLNPSSARCCKRAGKASVKDNYEISITNSPSPRVKECVHSTQRLASPSHGRGRGNEGEGGEGRDEGQYYLAPNSRITLSLEGEGRVRGCIYIFIFK